MAPKQGYLKAREERQRDGKEEQQRSKKQCCKIIQSFLVPTKGIRLKSIELNIVVWLRRPEGHSKVRAKPKPVNREKQNIMRPWCAALILVLAIVCNIDCKSRYRKRDGLKKMVKELQLQLKDVKVCYQPASCLWSVSHHESSFALGDIVVSGQGLGIT